MQALRTLRTPWRRVCVFLMLLTIACSVVGCQWTNRTLGKTAIGGLLDENKADDDAIKKAALKDPSFPAASEPMPK